MHMIAKLISFLSGGQTDFLIPLSHQWHGVNVAPALDLVAFGAALITVGLLVNCIWCALRRRPFGIAFILMLATATAAYAASSTLGNLSSGSAISATDLFYDVQSVGTGGVKVTGTQLQTWAGTVVQTGPGAMGGTCNPGATCTIQTALNPVTITSGNYTSSYYGELVNYNSASDQTPTLPQASAAGNGTFLVTCSIQHSQTVTPFSGDTIGGASTKSLPTGTQASPSCLTLTSDGISNWNVVPYSPQVDGATVFSNAGVLYQTHAHPGYITSNWYLPAGIYSTQSSGVANSANQIVCQYGYIPREVTIEALAAYIFTGAASSDIQLALYANANGRPAGLLSNTGNISTSGSNGAVSGSLGSNVQVGPNSANGRDIWLCYNSNNGTTTELGLSSGNPTEAIYQGSATLAHIFGNNSTVEIVTAVTCASTNCEGGSSTFGTWPSTLAGTTWTDSWPNTTGNQSMLIGFQAASSP